MSAKTITATGAWWWVPRLLDECDVCERAYREMGTGQGDLAAYSHAQRASICEGCVTRLKLAPKWSRRAQEAFGDMPERLQPPKVKQPPRQRSRERQRQGDREHEKLRQAWEAGHGVGQRKGFQEGYQQGLEHADAVYGGDALDADLLRAVIALCHPDRHPGRFDQANRVTAQLIALRDRGR